MGGLLQRDVFGLCKGSGQEKGDHCKLSAKRECEQCDYLQVRILCVEKPYTSNPNPYT